MAVKLQTHRVVPLGVLTIENGEQLSNLLTADTYAVYDAIMIASKDSALTGEVTLLVLNDVSADETDVGSYSTLESPPGTAVKIGAGKAVVLTDLPAVAFRLGSSQNETAERTFGVFGLRTPHA